MLAGLLPFVVLSVAAAVAASPVVIRESPVTLPIARRVNATSARELMKMDQARAKVLKEKGLAAAGKDSASFRKTARDAIFNVPITDTGLYYTTNVGIGTPPTQYTLLVDTGSASTWIGAGQPYKRTSSSVDTGQTFGVFYVDGLCDGKLYNDTVTLGGVAITGQVIGVADDVYGFVANADGILGIGPKKLNEIANSWLTQLPTPLDSAYQQGKISNEVVGISFEPTTDLSATNGELTFGAIDSSKYTGKVVYVPISSNSPAKYYVGIDQSITYGSAGTTILSKTSGITDTGTTNILIATDAFNAYKAATGAVMDDATGYLKITAAQFAKLESLFFHIGANTYELTPNAQIWPRSLNSVIGGDAGSIYLVVGDIGSNSGEDFDFIDGFAFIQRFYYVYDVENHRVGFANTPYTYATTN
ncbi:acid protease [Trametes sanguinea]|nr:acid protease [Trametes sanguinea]